MYPTPKEKENLQKNNVLYERKGFHRVLTGLEIMRINGWGSSRFHHPAHPLMCLVVMPSNIRTTTRGRGWRKRSSS